MSFTARLIVALAVCVWSAQSWAQTDPVTAHYRAYRAALERHDLASAEREAAAALAASEARDGEGGVTSVLAVNLAQVRLDSGQAEAAREPARRALSLAAGGDSRVDPIAVSLMLGRAELAAGEAGAATRIEEALSQASDIHVDQAYPAARDLAVFKLRNGDARGAIAVWDRALVFTRDPSRILWRAETLIGRGQALMSIDLISRPQAQTGSHIVYRPDANVRAAFDEAVQLLAPLASTPEREMTLAQARYAEALAWSNAERARLGAIQRDTAPYEGLIVDLDQEDGLAACAVRVIPEPMPEFPQQASRRWGVGSVIVRFVTDAAGRAVDARLAATAGDAYFTDSIDAVFRTWRLEPAPGATSPCSRASVLYVPVNFRFR